MHLAVNHRKEMEIRRPRLMHSVTLRRDGCLRHTPGTPISFPYATSGRGLEGSLVPDGVPDFLFTKVTRPDLPQYSNG